MKIFITGGTGQIGFELIRELSPWASIFAPTRAELDLYSIRAVSEYIDAHQPDIIINAAAYTAVDAAEKNEKDAFALNAELPEILALYAKDNNIPLVHYSSDYVYAGTGRLPQKEEDEKNPCNVYGKSKLAGDTAIIGSGARYVIFRTSWVYAARGKNFVKTMLRLGAERTTLNVVSDQIGAPTSARFIAAMTNAVLLREKYAPIPSAVYNLTPRGEVSWYGFAKNIFEEAKKLGIPLTLDPQAIVAVSSKEYPTVAQRPLNSRLCLAKLEECLGITFPSWEELLCLTLQEFVR